MFRYLILIGMLLCLAACADSSNENGGKTLVSVWAHSGQAAEREVLQTQIARFNSQQQAIQARLTLLPEGTYNGQVQASALADDMPCVLEFDGPYVYNYVWQGKLIPLDDFLTPALRRELLPSLMVQGNYRHRQYTVATFDSGLGLYARKSLLTKIGVRIPQGPDSAWSVAEFNAILQGLRKFDVDGQVLDMKLNYSGEWFAYGFSPVLQSAGGDLIDRSEHRSANGVLNGAAAVEAMSQLQSWIRGGYVDPNLDDAAFTQGRVALTWAGHWEYPRYNKAFGKDLLVLPLPDFGRGMRTGQGSWNWGITSSCKRPGEAWRFLAFLLRPEEVAAMTHANGAVPATRIAIARSPLYKAGGPLHLYARQLADGYSVPRPQTPAYPIISSAFEQAFRDIQNGGEVQAALDRAVAVIDRDIGDNKGYPPVMMHRDEARTDD
ncbi:MAG: extracellular solute-binding protein [Halioglobus sp.]|jgi:multiple sugar transport system substrate-binding protein